MKLLLMLVSVVVALTTITPGLHAASLLAKRGKDVASADYEPLDLSHSLPWL